MGLLNDSDAIFDSGKILPQHHALVTQVQAVLDRPEVEKFHWLDIACGQGQLFAQLEHNFKPELRSKIVCYLFDGQNELLKEALRTISGLGFQDVISTVGDISTIGAAFSDAPQFDLISCTNAFHELPPEHLPRLIFNSISRLSPSGVFSAYDMESLPAPMNELGAITWSNDEVEAIVTTLFDGLEVPDYRPSVSQLRHSSCNGWSVSIQRQSIYLDDGELEGRRDVAIDRALTRIKALLHDKLGSCRSLLNTLTDCGPESGEEQDKTNRLLYDFWALSRAEERLR